MHNIKDLLKLYEYLYVLNKPLAGFLGGVLPALSKNNWWTMCVKEKLDIHDLEIIKRKDISRLDEFDMGMLLKILLRNWWKVNKYNKEFNNEKYELTKQVRDIRNFTAHPNETEIPNFAVYFDRLRRFGKFIETNIDCSVETLHKMNEYQTLEKDNAKKLKLLELVNKNVFIPAVNCAELNEDIKESVKDTQKRLNSKATSKEVYDFFYDALVARRGKQVYSALKEARLLSFEDITDEFLNIYWRNQKN